MCGIVGLFLKDKSLEPQLGAMLSQMLSLCVPGRLPAPAAPPISRAPGQKATIPSLPAARDYRFFRVVGTAQAKPAPGGRSR